MAKDFHIAKDNKTAYQPLQSFTSENRYRAKKDAELAELEKEIEEAEKKRLKGEEEEENQVLEADPEDKSNDHKLSDEEKMWKKRYGDLRSHYSRKEAEWNSRFEELSQKIESQSEGLKYPTNEEEFQEWVKKYPKLVDAVQTLILKNNEGLSKEIKQSQAEIQRERQQIAWMNAYNKLLSKHPEFEELRVSDEFNEWLNKQPKNIYNSIHSPGAFDDEAVEAAAYTVQLFKDATGLGKKKSSTTRVDPNDAAKSVSRSRSENPDNHSGKPQFSESQVEQMSSREYEKNAKAIEEAIRDGRFEYDISGAAR